MSDRNVKFINQYLQKTDEALSRTVQNKSIITAASDRKRHALLGGDKLSRQISRNRRLIAEYVNWRQRYIPRRTEDFLTSILTLGEIAGLNLFPESSFRQWDYSGTHGIVFDIDELVAPSRILSTLITFASDLANRTPELATGSGLSIVAGTEWDIAIGPIHPFYDGCGRISRCFSTLLCLSFSLPIIWRGSREDYFSHAVRGRNDFMSYFVLCKRVGKDDVEFES